MDKFFLKASVFFSALVVVVLFSGFVSAFANVTNVTAESNSTALYDEGHFTLNWTIVGGQDDVTNYTLFLWMNDVMVSVDDTDVNDSSSGSIGGLTFTNSTQANYTFTLQVTNGTAGFEANATNVSMYIDTTFPGITIATPSAAGWQGNSNLTLHTNVTDALSNVTSSTISFGFENTTGNFSVTLPSSCSWAGVTNTGFNCSSSFDTSVLADGNYTFWINASDSAGNIANQSLLIGVDNTAPTVSLAKSSSTESRITVTTSCTDSGSGSATCSFTSSGGTVSGSNINSINCGQSYTVTLTGTDGVGNSVSTSSSLSSSACSSSSSSSSGGSGSPTSTTSGWTITHVIDSATFEAGYRSEVQADKRIQVQVGTESHHVGVVSVGTDKVTIEIASDPVIVSLAPGEDTKVDVTGNGYYDIYVILNAIVDGKADLTIQEINEAVPEGDTSSVTTTGEIQDDNPPVTTDDSGTGESSKTWLWVLVILVILVAIGLGAKSKR